MLGAEVLYNELACLRPPRTYRCTYRCLNSFFRNARAGLEYCIRRLVVWAFALGGGHKTHGSTTGGAIVPNRRCNSQNDLRQYARNMVVLAVSFRSSSCQTGVSACWQDGKYSHESYRISRPPSLTRFCWCPCELHSGIRCDRLVHGPSVLD